MERQNRHETNVTTVQTTKIIQYFLTGGLGKHKDGYNFTSLNQRVHYLHELIPTRLQLFLAVTVLYLNQITL